MADGPLTNDGRWRWPPVDARRTRASRPLTAPSWVDAPGAAQYHARLTSATRPRSSSTNDEFFQSPAQFDQSLIFFPTAREPRGPAPTRWAAHAPRGRRLLPNKGAGAMNPSSVSSCVGAPRPTKPGMLNGGTSRRALPPLAFFRGGNAPLPPPCSLHDVPHENHSRREAGGKAGIGPPSAWFALEVEFESALRKRSEHVAAGKLRTDPRAPVRSHRRTRTTPQSPVHQQPRCVPGPSGVNLDVVFQEVPRRPAAKRRGRRCACPFRLRLALCPTQG